MSEIELTGEIEVGTSEEQAYARTNLRIDNIIALNNDTEGNSELQDIRMGANAIVYSSAGDAVRNQISDINENIKYLTENKTLFIEIAGEIVDFRYTTDVKSDSTSNDIHGSKRFNVQNIPLVKVSMYTLLAINAITFVDGNNQVISYIRFATGFSASDMVYENIVVPENAVYMVCSNNPSNSANIRAYEIADDLTSKKIVSINDFSLDKAYTTSGSLTGDSTWKHTDFIPLENVLSISSMLGYFSNIVAIAFFDSSKSFISGITPQHTTTSEVTAYIPKVTVFPENAAYVVFSTRVSIPNPNYAYIEYQNMTISEIIDVLDNKVDKQDFSGLKFACFGDSITSDEVTGIGTKINRLLGTQLVGNFAHGNATCSDWYNAQNGNITTETPNVDHKDNDPTKTALSQNQNVLSNQVRRCLAYTTAANSNVTYHHQIDGDFVLNTSIWTGTGSTENTPDIIYIAVGINDGQTNNLTVDDTDTVFAQEYSQLDRCGFASSLRWAIETLLSAYPDAQFFVASPLQTGGKYTRLNYQNTLLKRNIVQKVCQYCSVNFIDSFSESGYNRMLSYGIASWDTDTVHPKPVWANRIAHYVAQKIRERYLDLT